MNEHYILDVASQKGKIDWPGAIQRSGAFPLDRSSVFSSLADAEVYIQGLPNDSRGLGATSYAGQFISVYDDTTKQVYPYLVQFTQNADGSLKKVLTRVLLTGDAVSGGSTTGTGTGSSLDDVSWILIDGGSADDAINMSHNAVCSVRCVDQDTKEVLYTATPLSAYFTAYNINNDNNYYINLDDISSVVKTLSWDGSDSYVFVGVDTDNTVVVNDNYVLNGNIVTCNYCRTSAPGTETGFKTATYTVKHCKYLEPVETYIYNATVPIDATMVPIESNSLVSKAGTGEFIGYTLADFIPYNTATEILDGTEVIINYVKTGDINQDRVIDALDQTAWDDYVGRSEEYHPIYDLNADGYINGDDSAILRDLIK